MSNIPCSCIILSIYTVDHRITCLSTCAYIVSQIIILVQGFRLPILLFLSTGVSIQASKFTTLAMKDTNSDTVQIEYSHTTSTIVAKVNGEAVDFTQLNPIPYAGNHISNWYIRGNCTIYY